jgi:hypothetical protein
LILGKRKKEWSALISLVLLFFGFRRWGRGRGRRSWLWVLPISVPLLMLQVKEIVMMSTMREPWLVGVRIVVVIMVSDRNRRICLC